MIDPALGRRNAFAIVQEVAAARNGSRTRCLMLDMEDESLVDVTIALHDELRASNLPAALTLQAYLRRTEDDLRAMLAQPCRVRLVKGAFAAGRRVAFQGQAAIKANFRRLTDLMLSGAAREAGFQPSFATHDHELHDYVLARAGAANWRPGEYEFEMLLGVRGDVAEGLARRGERVRLYLPFGHDWWPYAARRIGESPRNLWLLARSLAGPGRGDGLRTVDRRAPARVAMHRLRRCTAGFRKLTKRLQEVRMYDHSIESWRHQHVFLGEEPLARRAPRLARHRADGSHDAGRNRLRASS
jgi:hypothetical protein